MNQHQKSRASRRVIHGLGWVVWLMCLAGFFVLFALWVCGSARMTTIAWRRATDETISIAVSRGDILASWYGPPNSRGANSFRSGVRFFSTSARRLRPVGLGELDFSAYYYLPLINSWPPIEQTSQLQANFLGFGWLSRRSRALWPKPSSAAVIDAQFFVAPCFAVETLMLCLCVLTTPRTIRSRCRRKKGLCEFCGYDLRSSSERCPECGRSTTVRT